MAATNPNLNNAMANMNLKAPGIRGPMPAHPSSFAPPFSVQRPPNSYQQPSAGQPSYPPNPAMYNSWQSSNSQIPPQIPHNPNPPRSEQTNPQGSYKPQMHGDSQMYNNNETSNGYPNGVYGSLHQENGVSTEVANGTSEPLKSSYNIQQQKQEVQNKEAQPASNNWTNGPSYQNNQHSGQPPVQIPSQGQPSETPGVPVASSHSTNSDASMYSQNFPPRPQMQSGAPLLSSQYPQTSNAGSQGQPYQSQPFNPYQQGNQRPQLGTQPPPGPPAGFTGAAGFAPQPRMNSLSGQPARGPFPGSYPPMPPPSGMGSGYPSQPPRPTQPSNMSPPGGAPMGPMDPMQQHPSPPAPPQQPRSRLDPDMMPSPITVLADDQKARGDEPFQTGNRMQPAGVPPLCTTNFVSIDQGNCRPQFLRSSLYSIPVSKDMCNSSRLPICLAVQPFAQISEQESPVPLADCTATRIPIRCNRCKAYMSPLMVFVDGGRKFECLLCGCVNDVPEAFFCHLDHTGLRMDTYHRPELCIGSYEYLAPVEYCKNEKLPKEPAYIFMIDVSAHAIRSGMVHLLCNKMKHILEMLPKANTSDSDSSSSQVSPIRVGFATYSHVVHFYNLTKGQSRPQMQIVADTNDIFLPSLEGFLVQFNSDTKDIIEKVLSQVPKMFANNMESDPILGPVMQAGLDALKSDGRAGKLFIFHTAMPTREAPGKLKPRDNHKLLGTDKEKTILKPQTDFYSKLGVECVRAGCSVDLFLFPFAHVDVATLAEVPKLTGGQIHLYNNFQPVLDGDMLMSDVANCVQKEYAFDAMVRVRTSAGLRPCDFHGNFYMETAQDVELGAMDPDKCVLVELKHDDKLDENAGAHVQVALLYTSFAGERRLRIHNMSFSCCTQLSDMYKAVETDVLVNWIGKEAARALLKDSPKQVKERIVDLCANSLACYRKNCANPSSPGQLILPESMKLLPVYANNVLKSQALSGSSDITVDNRAFLMHVLNSMTISASCAYFYPRLIPVHAMESSSGSGESVTKLIPPCLRCSADKLDENGCYIIENGLLMVLWLGQALGNHWMQQVFGVDSVAQLDTEGVGRHTIPVSDTPLNERLRNIISTIRSQRKKYLKLYVVKQRDKLDMWVRTLLLEDKGMDNSPSYVDFLCHMHKEIRNLLN